jgi:magnesium and cobalt exporter, CNNM family
VNIGLELTIIVLLTLMNAVFAAAEIAILAVRKTRLQELADEGRAAAAAALKLRENPEQFLATVQVGITVLGATAGAIGGATLAEPLAGWLTGFGFGRYAYQFSLTLIVALLSILSIVIGELVPKSLALRSSELLSLLLARPLLALSRLARPVVWFLTAASNLLLRPFKDRTTFTEARLSPDELRQLVDEAATAGALDPRAGDIATRAFDLSSLRVSALMVPRQEVVSLRRDDDRETVWEAFKRAPHSRYPVVGDTPAQLGGYVVARDLVMQIVETGQVNVGAATRQAPFFPESAPAVEALRALQHHRTGIGIVVDEQGDLAGILTMSDIAQEVFGEILTEGEDPVEWIVKDSEESVLVLGSTPVHDLNRELETDLPEGPRFTTVAGMLIAEAGRMVGPGESFQIGDVRVDVVDASPRQVRRVRLHLPPGTHAHA